MKNAKPLSHHILSQSEIYDNSAGAPRSALCRIYPFKKKIGSNSLKLQELSEIGPPIGLKNAENRLDDPDTPAYIPIWLNVSSCRILFRYNKIRVLLRPAKLCHA